VNIKMRILVFSMFSIFLLHPGWRGYLDPTEDPQDARSISSRELLAMFHSVDSVNMRKALSLIGDIYASRYNEGIIPDEDTLYGLGQVVADYLSVHPDEMDQAAERVVVKALRDAPGKIQEHKLFWEKAYAAAQTYFSNPSSENADRLYRLLPDRRLPGLDFTGEVRLSGFFYNGGSRESHLDILIKRAGEGDPRALDICFRLINISDGAFGEDLVYDLGTVIPTQPRLFLEKLLANQGLTEPPVLELLDGILHPVGWWEIRDDDPDHVKYKELRNTRIDIRIKALKTVQNPQLRELRDRCISILEKMRDEILG
jgi:hypothetical protein